MSFAWCKLYNLQAIFLFFKFHFVKHIFILIFPYNKPTETDEPF